MDYVGKMSEGDGSSEIQRRKNIEKRCFLKKWLIPDDVDRLPLHIPGDLMETAPIEDSSRQAKMMISCEALTNAWWEGLYFFLVQPML